LLIPLKKIANLLNVPNRFLLEFRFIIWNWIDCRLPR